MPGQTFQPGRQIDLVPEHGVAEALLGPDGPGDESAVVDAGTEFEAVLASAPAFGMECFQFSPGL